MPKTQSHYLWLQHKNIYLSTLWASQENYRTYLTLKTVSLSMWSLRNFRNRSGTCNRLSTEGPLMPKKDPLVGAARITCHHILTKRRDTSPASFRNHQSCLAGCSENNNTLYSSNKCDSCTVEWKRRHCVHKYGFRQISDISGNVRNYFL
jgi:hypothetical protein